MRWQRWALAGSLAVNVAGASYAVYRLVREPPPRPEHYRMDRMDQLAQLDRSATAPVRVVMLGDSLTDRGEWHELLAEPSVANRGIAGDTIRGATARVPTLASLDPAIVGVMLGINDLLGGRSVAACVQDYRELLAALERAVPRARIVVQSVLPVRPPATPPVATIAALNRELRGLCEAHGCTYVDVHAALTGPDGLLAPELTRDGVHLTGEGYVRWRDVVRPHLTAR